MNAVNVMDVKKQSDRDKVGRILDAWSDDFISEDAAIIQIFDLFTPKQYQLFEVSDFNEFMLKQVRRKGEAFKDEVWIVEGCKNHIKPNNEPGVLITLPTVDDYYYSEWKSFQTIFDEWEFINGDIFGKLI